MHTSLTTEFTLRLCIESKAGAGWTAITTTCTSITAAAHWRNTTLAWCDRNPLPDGYQYWIPLPKPTM